MYSFYRWDPKQLWYKIDHIAFCLAAKAVVVLIQDHAWRVIVMKRTSGHPPAICLDPIKRSRRSGGHNLFYLCEIAFFHKYSGVLFPAEGHKKRPLCLAILQSCLPCLLFSLRQYYCTHKNVQWCIHLPTISTVFSFFCATMYPVCIGSVSQCIERVSLPTGYYFTIQFYTKQSVIVFQISGFPVHSVSIFRVHVSFCSATVSKISSSVSKLS